PVAISYLFITDDDVTFLTDVNKVKYDLLKYFNTQKVDAYPIGLLKSVLSSHPKANKVLFDPTRTSATVASYLGDRAVPGKFSIAEAKACKNEKQIEGIRNAMVRDGVALVKAFKEIDEIMVRGGNLTELDVSALLVKYRSEQALFFEESFGTIAAYGSNGAIVHYEPDESSNAVIRPEGLLLVDSGAQYLDGTTDITRTICMGQPTEMEKHDFTLVMKGHIALAEMVFPQGTYGMQLDAEARKFLWREGLTYLHGTGHGVGQFLNVHEGPQQIRMNYIPATLRVGMVTSNEPGLYRENIHGIRCENLLLCVKAMTTEFCDFLKFETLTLFPFDLHLFATEIMSEEEITWINDYHTMVRERLSPYLTPDERAWLESKTAPLHKA
ncbi:MAG: M24 family metallopeptidase, partial [Muribaculaceae bacterium]|nr:M24 family metallopeptidase [Muribaculaceae bacterium]